MRKVKLKTFVKERNWEQFHNPKDLAISINLEASELLECFQWIDSEQAIKQNSENIQDELSDIILYCIRLADILDIDLKQAIEIKMAKNQAKYPVEKAYGKSTKYNKF